MCVTKIPLYGIYKLLSFIYFQNMCSETGDFRRKNWHIVLLSIRFWYCCSGIYLLETSNSVIKCIIIVPDCDLSNVTKFSNFMDYS